MFEMRRTIARSVFKDLLGQANHFLITILVGLDAVKTGAAGLNEEFRTSWNPQSAARSAERSRLFALDLSLIRAVDALDTYFMTCNRKPFAIAAQQFTSRMDGTGRSVARRLEVFLEFLPGLPDHEVALVELAIDWRNQRVHSLADESLGDDVYQRLLDSRQQLLDEHSGLSAEEIIANHRSAVSPTFKEAASIIRGVHRAVEHFDQLLLRQVDLDSYIRESLAERLSISTNRQPQAALKHACHKIWDDKPQKRNKVLRALRLIGVSETPEVRGREVSDDLIEKLASMTPQAAYDYLKPASA